MISLRFSGGGLFSSEGNWIHSERVINSYELIVVTRGELYISEGEHDFSLRANDYILLHPDTVHAGTRVSEKAIEFYWLHFMLEADNGGFPPPPDLVNRIIAPCSGTLVNPSIVVQNARQLIQCSGSVGYPDDTVDHLMYVLLSELLVQRERQAPLNAFAQRIYEYVRSYSHKPLTVTDVADAFGYHPDHLSRVLKNCYGMTLKRVIAKQRIDRARLLLQTTDLTVSQISIQLGYSDPNLFEKFFRYHTGVTPTAFRADFSRLHTNHI